MLDLKKHDKNGPISAYLNKSKIVRNPSILFLRGWNGYKNPSHATIPLSSGTILDSIFVRYT